MNLVQVQKAFADRMDEDLWFYSITLQPEADTPEVLADYVDKMGVGPGWTFLTGRPEDIQQLRENLGYYDPEEPDYGTDLASHLGFLLMGNEPYGWWGTVPATADPNQIELLIDWLDPGARGLR